MSTLRLPAAYYQQFDADYSRDVPAEGFGGWKKADVEISREHTAVVVMHAWDAGTFEQYPGWYRAIEYLPRAAAITRNVLPPLLAAVRETGFPLFHVVGYSDYFKDCPGYQRAVTLAGPPPPARPRCESDPVLSKLHEFRRDHVAVGRHNEADCRHNFSFPPEARPRDNEDVAETSHQLFGLCRHHKINHLIYAGFAINWCILMVPGGMLDMHRHGLLCSAFGDAVTAVENKETARQELAKQIELWRVALGFGFVFETPDFIRALKTQP